jgi:hypothetical protein
MNVEEIMTRTPSLLPVATSGRFSWQADEIGPAAIALPLSELDPLFPLICTTKSLSFL